MKVKKLSKNNIKLLIIILMLAGSCAYLFYLVPKILDLRSELPKVKNTVAILQKKVSLLQSLSSNQATLNTHQAEFSKALPKEIDVPTFMERISKVASSSGISTESFTYSGKAAVKTKSDVKSVEQDSFQFSGKGNYDAVDVFVRTLENFAGLVSFNDFSIKASKDGSSAQPTTDDVSSDLNITLKLTAYYMPEGVVTVSRTTEDITVDLTAQEYINALNIAKSLTMWEVAAYENSVGRTNPFIR